MKTVKNKVSTPIVDYITEYAASDSSRLHMPGHKGKAPDFLPEGFKETYRYDITEITGADDLYAPSGIIKESEENASEIFGAKTFYSPEGSSLSVKAMIYLALKHYERNSDSNTEAAASKSNGILLKNKPAPYIITVGTCHKSFFHATGLLNIETERIENRNHSGTQNAGDLLPEIQKILSGKKAAPIGLYVPCPDYFGNIINLKELKSILSGMNIPLLVDAAHGAYFKFLDKEKYAEYTHPVDGGADLSCTSAHKTLPTLTGAAYLHINESFLDVYPLAKHAMEIFGSSSPSYLILASLDAFNAEAAKYKEDLSKTCVRIEKLKNELSGMGFHIKKSDPLRIVVLKDELRSGKDFASSLRKHRCEYECFDDGYVILMLTPYNSEADLSRIREAFETVKNRPGDFEILPENGYNCLKNFS